MLSLSLAGSAVIQMAERKTADCFKCVASPYVRSLTRPQGLSDKQLPLSARLLKHNPCGSLSSANPQGQAGSFKKMDC